MYFYMRTDISFLKNGLNSFSSTALATGRLHHKDWCKTKVKAFFKTLQENYIYYTAPLKPRLRGNNHCKWRAMLILYYFTVSLVSEMIDLIETLIIELLTPKIAVITAIGGLIVYYPGLIYQCLFELLNGNLVYLKSALGTCMRLFKAYARDVFLALPIFEIGGLCYLVTRAVYRTYTSVREELSKLNARNIYHPKTAAPTLQPVVSVQSSSSKDVTSKDLGQHAHVVQKKEKADLNSTAKNFTQKAKNLEILAPAISHTHNHTAHSEDQPATLRPPQRQTSIGSIQLRQLTMWGIDLPQTSTQLFVL